MKKKCTAIMLGIAFLMLGAVPAQAEDGMDAPLSGLGIIFSQDEAGNLQVGAAVGYTDGTDRLLLSDEGVYEESFSDYYIYVSDSEVYEVEYLGGYEEFPLEIWGSADYPADGYFELAPAGKKEEVTVFYVNWDADWESQRVTITDIYADGEYTCFDTELDTSVIGSYPAAVVNTEGQLVAVVTNDGKMLSTDTTISSVTPGKILVILIAAAAAGILLIVFLRKRKAAEKRSPEEEAEEDEWKWSEEEPDPAELPESIPETISETAPVREETIPIEDHAEPADMRYIRAVGGYMNGRIYEISQSEMLFGRDVSCAVRYAREAKNAKGISRIHCKLYRENGSLWLLDMDSTYGTYLADYGKLQKGIPIELKKGSVFYLADKTNGFEIC